MTAQGVSAVEIADRLDLSPEAVSRIRRRFLDGGIEAMHDRPKAGRKDHALTSETIEYIVQLALSPPPRGRSRWTTRLLASYFGITSGAVSDVLRMNGLKPHLTGTSKVSRDPQFVEKVKDVLGLLLAPPEHAIVLGLEERTSTRAPDRKHRGAPGRAARHTHDQERQGVLELCAALEVATGKVTRALEKSRARSDVLSFLKNVARAYRGEELHVLLDNSSSHGTPELRDWLSAYPRVHLHYAPTSASWLSQVEGFFNILGEQSRSSTDHQSRNASSERLRAHLRAWKQNPTPFEWTKPARELSK
jgi:transposase